jgi:hypothetical protein
VAWPVTAAVIAAISAAGARRGPPTEAVSLAIAVVALAWVGSFLHGLMQGLDMPELPTLTLWLAAILLWPLAWPAKPGGVLTLAPAGGALAVALGTAAFLASTSPWSARYPQATAPWYVVDHDSGKAWRASQGEPGAWTRAVLTADGGAIGRQSFPTFRRPLFAAPATPVAADQPPISLAPGADGTVTLTLQLPPDVDSVQLTLRPNTVITNATVNGQAAKILGMPGRSTYVRWSRSTEPLIISFKPGGPGALDIAYAAYLDHWPASAKALPAMPPTVMGFDTAGDTLVVGTKKVSW